MKPGAKYYDWERKGVPLRLEVGPRDVAKGAAFAARRIGGPKFGIEAEGIGARVLTELDAIQNELLERARTFRNERMFELSDYGAFKDALSAQGGWYLVPWCDDAEAENQIKSETKATIRCFPIGRQDEAAGQNCFYSGKPATHMALFSRAY